ncbi:MAG: hypothetical protein RDU76_11815 [Candidatus Edwardsbacteria bacterium]|nr:hypothetical protein [Candidatus Edwardsbacteria bacterium]
MSDDLVNKIRKENHLLRIYAAFQNNHEVIGMANKLIAYIQSVYKSLEPDHFDGHLIIYATIDDSIIPDRKAAIDLFDQNLLINNKSDTIIIQYFKRNNLPLLWQNVNAEGIIKSTNAIVYYYHNHGECFYANNVKIEIDNYFDCASIFALQYHYLTEALLKYKEEKIRYSSCSRFKECWFDDKQIYFKQQPEEKMQISLKDYLGSSLRGVDVVREYNLGASKPVDVRVYWKEANRAALIEVKWLGQSKNQQGGLSTAYSNSRGNDGLDQLKVYLDLEKQDTPTCITKGYLVIVDGRRRGVAENPTVINGTDGMHYKNQEITFAPDKKHYETMVGFEKPIRMFAEPICTG